VPEFVKNFRLKGFSVRFHWVFSLYFPERFQAFMLVSKVIGLLTGK